MWMSFFHSFCLICVMHCELRNWATISRVVTFWEFYDRPTVFAGKQQHRLLHWNIWWTECIPSILGWCVVQSSNLRVSRMHLMMMMMTMIRCKRMGNGKYSTFEQFTAGMYDMSNKNCHSQNVFLLVLLDGNVRWFWADHLALTVAHDISNSATETKTLNYKQSHD